MRSKTLSILVCLVSCVPTFLSADDEWFCPSGPPDCTEKDISEADFKWSHRTSFNARKAVPKFTDLEFDMHRALYIENTDAKMVINFKPIDKTQCTLVLKKQAAEAATPVYEIDEIKEDIKITVQKNSKAVVAVFDPKCRLTAKLQNAKEMSHIFMRNIPTMPMPSELLESKDDLGNFIDVTRFYKNKRENDHESALLSPNLFYEYEEASYKFVDSDGELCYYKCQYGRIFEFQLDTGIHFANTFKINAKCEWMTIHLNANNMREATEISLRHGFVILPTELRAYPIDFKTNDKEQYEVIVTYHTVDKHSHIIIANRHGKAVYKPNSPDNTGNMKFAFSHDDCLADVIGAQVEDADANKGTKKAKNFEFKENLNLGYLVATQKEWYGKRYITKGVNDPNEIYPDETNKDVFQTKYKAKSNEVGVWRPVRAQTTASAATVDPGTSAPRAYAPITYVSNETMAELEKNSKYDAAKKEKMQEAMNGKIGYKYWAIPAGFATGSFASFLIANIILFVFKRTVFTFWYKAMYKRYGSDTTMGAGTTMGKTGAGETVGGGTTAGGGTTMGGTTAGESGSTTAA